MNFHNWFAVTMIDAVVVVFIWSLFS